MLYTSPYVAFRQTNFDNDYKTQKNNLFTKYSTPKAVGDPLTHRWLKYSMHLMYKNTFYEEQQHKNLKCKKSIKI